MDHSPADEGRGRHGMRPRRRRHVSQPSSTHNASATGSPQDAFPRTSGSTSLPNQAAGPDAGAAKRTARGKACERCRKMKIKCDGRTPKCGTCRRRALQCVFTYVDKPPKPMKREEYVRGLEDRLSRLESIVETSGILDDGPGEPGTANSDYSDFDFDIHSPLIDDGPSGLNTARESPESPRVAHAASPADLWGLASRSSRRPEWISDIIQDVVSRGLGPPTAASPQSMWPGRRPLDQDKQLPPMDDVLSLVADYFASCNQLFPLYHEETFMGQLYENMAMPAKASSAWWAGLYTMLATAHIVRLRGTFFPQEQERKAYQYIKKAIAIQTESPVLDFDIPSAQALIGMALFFRITSFSSQMPSMLIATAIRIAHALGLHLNSQDPLISDVEKEQRSRIFWIAYIFDCDLSLRTGRAPLHSPTNMSLALPLPTPPSDTAGTHLDGTNLFRTTCALAQLQSAIYTNLYAACAAPTPSTTTTLDHALEAWRAAIPAPLRPRNPLPQNLPPPYGSQVFLIHCGYWHAFALIHRRDDAGAEHPPGAKALEACRALVALLEEHPPGAKGLRWYILYYTAAALVCLFMHILHAPRDETAEQDLARMQAVLRFMGVTCGEGEGEGDGDGNARSLLAICTRLEGIAGGVLEGRGTGEEREWVGRRVQGQLRFHGRFFTALDV